MSDSELFGASDGGSPRGSESPASPRDDYGSPLGSASPSGSAPGSPEPAPEPVHRAANMKRYAPSHDVTNSWTSRVPAFLKIEPLPFDAAKFKGADKSAEQMALEANTVRWTYAAAGEEQQKVTRISNARIVDWSDGSRTLQLGNEHFEIKTHAQADPTFVCTRQDEESLLATRHLVWQSMSFLPTSTSSATHVMLAQALASKQQSGQIRVGSVNTTEDPDKLQREVEKAVQAKDKARRKLASQQEDVVSYTDRSARATQSDEDMIDDGSDESEAAESDQSEQSEAQATDSDEDEDRASRLNRIKHDEPVQRRKVLDDDSD